MSTPDTMRVESTRLHKETEGHCGAREGALNGVTRAAKTNANRSSPHHKAMEMIYCNG